MQYQICGNIQSTLYLAFFNNICFTNDLFASLLWTDWPFTNIDLVCPCFTVLLYNIIVNYMFICYYIFTGLAYSVKRTNLYYPHENMHIGTNSIRVSIIILGDPEVTANLCCNFAYLLGRLRNCSIYLQ